MQSSTRNNRSPFTATQWEELEHQALIFKYMVSGLPIPPQLISSVKRSFLYSSSSSSSSSTIPSSTLFPHHQPTYGYGYFQMGFGKKTDLEPGRCKRTDGKKWRCSKEAHTDSKYCERHMHRGRNRSRKPVELTSTSSSSSSTTHSLSSITTASHSLSTPSSSSSVTSETNIHNQHLNYQSTTPHHPFLYPPSSRPQNNNPHQELLLDSASYSHPDKHYRFVQGMRTFSHEVSENVRRTHLSSSYSPLTMNSPTGYSELQFESLTQNSKHVQKQNQEEDEQQHCFVLGTDFKSQRPPPPPPIKEERGERNQKPFHHFLGESRDSWLHIEENQSNHDGSFSTTQLSVSRPLSTQELFASKSRFHNDG